MSAYVVSDIHGNFTKLFRDLLKYYSNCKVFVAGDCGFGFYKYNYYRNMFTKYNPMLEKKNIKVYFMRGNHDDPSYFSKQRLKFKNLILVRDYEIIDRILFIGGAISIDKMFRVDNEDYWKDERVFKKEEIEFLDKSNIDFSNVDIVISHEAPMNANPKIDAGICISNELKEEIDECKSILQSVLDEINPKKWYYGHYHKYNSETINNTEVICIPEYDSYKDIFEL